MNVNRQHSVYVLQMEEFEHYIEIYRTIFVQRLQRNFFRNACLEHQMYSIVKSQHTRKRIQKNPREINPNFYKENLP